MRESIFALVSLSKTDFSLVYDGSLSNLANESSQLNLEKEKFAQSIAYGVKALKVRRGFVLPSSIKPELAHHTAEQWTFAVFYTAVLKSLNIGLEYPVSYISPDATKWLEAPVKTAIVEYLGSGSGELLPVFEKLAHLSNDAPSPLLISPAADTSMATTSKQSPTGGTGFQYYSCLFGYLSALPKKVKDGNLFDCEGVLFITHSVTQKFLAHCAPGERVTAFAGLMGETGCEVKHQHIITGETSLDGWIIPEMLALMHKNNLHFDKASMATDVTDVDWLRVRSDIEDMFGDGPVAKKPFRKMLILKHRTAPPYSVCAQRIKEATDQNVSFVD